MSDTPERLAPSLSLAQIGARAFLALSAVIAVFVPLWLWFAWVNTEQTHLHRTQMIASLVAGYADNYFRYTGTELTRLGEALRTAQAERDPRRAGAAIERFGAGHPDLLDIAVVPAGAHPADANRDADHPLAVDPPRFDARWNSWLVPIRLAVRDEHNRVLFHLRAAIGLPPPHGLWRHFRQADNATVGLAWPDGRQLSRAPRQDAVYGEPGFNPGLTRAIGLADEGAYRGADAGGVAHYGGYMRLEHFPLYAFLSFPRASVAVVWWRGVRIPLLVMVITFLGAVLIYRRLSRRLAVHLEHVGRVLEPSVAPPGAADHSGVREIDQLCSALLESRERLRLAADNREHKLLSAAHAGTYDVRADDDVIIGANPRFLEMLGRKPAEVIGKRWSEVLPEREPSPRTRAAPAGLTRRLIAVPHAQNQRAWLAIAEYQEEHDGRILCHGLAIDMSERERLLLSVRRQSEQFQRLWRIANDRSASDTEKLSQMLHTGLESLDMDAVVVSEQVEGVEVVRFQLGPQDLLSEPDDGGGGDDRRGSGEATDAAPFVADTEGADPRTVSGRWRRRGVRSHWRVPILADAEARGALEFLRREPVATEPGSEQRQLVELLASWLGQVLAQQRRHVELESMALTDSLTGLPNRRAAESRFNQELARARANGDGVAVALVDHDHFKRINDRYGHDAGDAVLRRVAVTMKHALRGDDWIARWGGEEFLVFLHAARESDVLVAAERLRSTVAAQPVVTSGRPVSVTLSVGVCTARDGELGMDALLAEADRALYQAKHAGRDRVVAKRISA
jgi:diguanylate cyclase (GGDEF)-like protein